MSATQGDGGRLALPIVGVGFLCAVLVGSWAARDALFLAHFEVAKLPLVLVGSAVTGCLLAVLFARRTPPRRPRPVVGLTLALLALALVVERLLLGWLPRAVAIALYIQTDLLGSLLLGMQGRALAERLGLQMSPKRAAALMTALSVGSLGAGFGLWALAPHVDMGAVLLLLAATALGGAALWLRVVPADRRGRAVGRPAPSSDSVGSRSYLARVAVLILVAGACSVPFDYALKEIAAARASRPEDLLRFFGGFYALAGFVGFLLEGTFARIVLAWVGLGGALGALPLATLAGAAAVLLGPGLAGVGAARAVEFSVRRALHRPAMDLLYTPLPLGPRDRARWLGNVGGERLGEALGGALVVLVLALARPGTPRPLGLLALGLGAVLAVLVWRLRGAYVTALEEGLTRRAVELEEVDLADRTTRTMVAERRRTDLPSSWGESSVAIPQEEIRRALEEIARRQPGLGEKPSEATGSQTIPPWAHVVEPEKSPEPRSSGAAPAPRLVSPPGPTATRSPEPAWRAALLSGDAARIRAVLRDADLPRAAATSIVPLLADEDLAGDAIQALRALAPRVTGLLVDVLSDGTEPLAVRRRLPRVLMAVATPRAVDGLLRGLEDVRSEIRLQCGRALARLHHDHPELAFDRDRVMGLVRAEAQRGKQVWASQQALERYEIEDSPLVDEVLRDRATRSLEHVFALLSLVLPLQPLRIAFSGLHTEDEALRRTALEYLESVLPAEVRTSLWPLVAERGAPPRPAQTQDALADLMRANQSIQISLEELRRQLRREP